MTWARPF